MSDRPGVLTGWRRAAVPASLILSFIANDGEEVLTMAGTLPKTLAKAPRPVRAIAQHRRVTQNEVNVAVAIMGALYAAAAIDGYRSRGRGWLYQNAQLLFGLHGFTHLASSVATRGYSSGVATSPTIVIPQWLWARAQLRHDGVPDRSRLMHAAPLVLGWLAVAHATAGRITRDWDQGE